MSEKERALNKGELELMYKAMQENNGMIPAVGQNVKNRNVPIS